MAGIETIKKVLKLAIETAVELKGVLDATTTFARLQAGIGLGDNIMNVATIDFAAMKTEFMDLDATERMQIKTHVAQHLDLADEALETLIEKTFDWIIDTANDVNRGVKLGKEWSALAA